MTAGGTASEQFHAMGVAASLTVHTTVGTQRETEEMLRLAHMRVEMLEQSWSRFRPSSELTLLNSQAGNGPVQVSDDMWLLLSAMKQGWVITDGRFDPTVHHAIVNLGYDNTLTSVPWNNGTLDGAEPTPGMNDIHLDSDSQTVTLPAGVTVDSGGIGKGLAGDIITFELMSAGASGVIVDLGGDVVFRGAPRHSDTWNVHITPRKHNPLTFTATAPDGHLGVATSGLRTRQWGDHLFHIVDPTVGLPAATPVDEVTVIASAGWLAEIHSKGALLAGGEADDYLERQGLDGALFWGDGSTTVTRSLNKE